MSAPAKLSDVGGGHTPGPWEYIPSNENHGAYVAGPWGGDICDCYTMSNLSDRAVCNGGTSRPVPFQGEASDANARLIAAAPDMLAALQAIREWLLDSDLIKVDDRKFWNEAFVKSNNLANAAIARATGAA